jgi:hypothetical protein
VAALEELLAALKMVGASNEKVAGWICAALTSLIRNHPSNLAALGALGGAVALAEALAAHGKKSEAGRDAAIALAQLQHGGFVERDRVVTAQMCGRLDEMLQDISIFDCDMDVHESLPAPGVAAAWAASQRN